MRIGNMPTSPDMDLKPLEAPETPDALEELQRDLLPIPSEEIQRDLAGQTLSDYQAAIDDRAEWEQGLEDQEKQYLGIQPKKLFPWKGCSNHHVPITMLGIETLKPRLIETVLGADPMYYAIPTEGSDEERAETTQLFLNWQMRTELGIDPIVEESAHLYLTPGTVVGKILWRKDRRRIKAIRTFPAETPLDAIFDALFGSERPAEWEESKGAWSGHFRDRGGAKRDVRARFAFTEDEIHVLLDKEAIIFDGPRVELIDAVDFVAPFRGGADVQRLPWCAQVLHYDENMLRRKVEEGRFYEDAVRELLGENPPVESTEQSGQALADLRSQTEGVVSDPATSVRADEYMVIERYCRWDIDDDGYEEEIIVWTCDQLPDRILGWDYLDNVFAHGKRPFVVGRYLKLPGRFYGLSFPEVVRDLQDEINTIHNQRVDAGTVQNTPSGFFRASMTMPPGPMRVSPGTWLPLDNPQTDAREIRWSGTPTWGFNEESTLYQMFERLTGITDLALGRQPNRVGATRTASGTAALLSEAGLRFKTAMEGFQRFWLEIGEHILALDQQYLPEGKEFRVTGKLPEIMRIESREEIAGRFHLRLAATSETLNKQVMRDDATIKLNAALQSPIPLQLGLIGGKGLRRLYREFFRAFGEQDPDMILEPLGDQIVHTPEQELAIWSSGGDVRPSMMENIPAHIEAHMGQLQDPAVQKDAILREKIEAHLSETMQLAQMQAMSNMLQGGGSGKGRKGPVAGDQTMNAQTGRQAPQAPAQYGNGPQMGAMA